MSIEIILGLMLLCWLHGRLYPATMDLIEKQQERRLEARREKARQKFYGERFGKESVNEKT